MAVWRGRQRPLAAGEGERKVRLLFALGEVPSHQGRRCLSVVPSPGPRGLPSLTSMPLSLAQRVRTWRALGQLRCSSGSLCFLVLS